MVTLFFTIKIQTQEQYEYPGGSFVGSNGNWLQKNNQGSIKWIESAKDREWITLYNPQNEQIIMIPIHGGQVFQALDKTKRKWKPLFLIKNLSEKRIETSPPKKIVENIKKDVDKKETDNEEEMTGCLSEQEASLVRKILSYRAKNNLKPIAVSRSLSHVAKIHAKDLSHNPPPDNCTYQSWSTSNKWSGCCYTIDHSQVQCMLNKPRELTDYSADGYEIVFEKQEEEISPEKLFEKLKSGFGFGRVINNREDWEKEEWKAMGISIFGRYVILWLGTEKDPKPVPGICRK